MQVYGPVRLAFGLVASVPFVVACHPSSTSPSLGEGGGGAEGVLEAGAGGVVEGPNTDAAGLPPFPEPLANGSRLRARYWLTSDGLRQPDTLTIDGRIAQVWFDSELEVPCVFRPVGEAYRCLPVTAFEVLHGQLEEGCGAPLDLLAAEGIAFASLAEMSAAERDGLCGERRYALDQGWTDPYLPTTDEVVAIYELGAPRDLKRWSAGAANSCRSVVPPEGIVPFSVGARIDVEELVGAEFELLDTSRRLTVTRLLASDGSVESLGLYDTELETECLVRGAAGEQERCVPKVSGGVYVGYGNGAPYAYADPECKTIWGVPLDANPPESGFVEEPGVPGYERPAQVFRIAGPSKGIYHLGDGECFPGDPMPGSLPTWALELIEPSSLVAMYDVSTRVGDVDAAVSTDRQGAQAVRPRLMNASLGEECSFQLVGEGAGRCLPASLLVVYEGAECQVPLVDNPETSYPEGAPLYGREWQGDRCSGELVLRERAEPRGEWLSTTSIRTQTGCRQLFHGGDFPEREDLYRAGAPISLDGYAEATLEHD